MKKFKTSIIIVLLCFVWMGLANSPKNSYALELISSSFINKIEVQATKIVDSAIIYEEIDISMKDIGVDTLGYYEENYIQSATPIEAYVDISIVNWEELPGELSIMVNKQASCVTIYKGEIPIKAMVCSAGESTPEGTFSIQNKWKWLNLIEYQCGQYTSQITGDYLFHSVPYNSMNVYNLDTSMYNQLGTLCSHGCIRLKVEDAKWIYDNCDSGTEVTIYSDENPGPLGKPYFEQIPENQTWDPTDEVALEGLDEYLSSIDE